MSGLTCQRPDSSVLHRDERVRIRVTTFLVDEERRVEDLERLVRVERDHDLCDRAEVPVEERAEALRVVCGARAGPPGDEELEPRRAERVLLVYEQ